MSHSAIPILDLVSQYASIRDEVRAAVDAVMDRQEFILGREVRALESELAGDLGVRHCLGTSSGTDSLLLAFMALGIGPGDEVIVPAFTFFATAGAVSRLGARPVFADVDPATGLLNLQDAAARVTKRTRAIVPVHLYGQSVDMDTLTRIAALHRLAIVEDCAQSIGATWKGRQTGSFGDIGCFSFFPSKNLGAFGDAGLVSTQSDRLAEGMRILRAHGAMPKYWHHVVGGNFRLDEIQAAVLRVKRRHLGEWAEGRAQVAAWYGQRWGGLPVAAPTIHHDAGMVWHQYTIRILESSVHGDLRGARDAIHKYLESEGIQTMIYYPYPLHLLPCFADLGGQAGDLPGAELAAASVLSLPIDPALSEDHVDRVVGAIRRWFGA